MLLILKESVVSSLIIVRNVLNLIIDYVRTKPSNRIIKTYGQYIYKKIGGERFEEQNQELQKDIYIKPIHKALIKIEKPEGERIIEEANYEAAEAIDQYKTKTSMILTIGTLIYELVFGNKIKALLLSTNLMYHRIMIDREREQYIFSIIMMNKYPSKIAMLLLTYCHQNKIPYIHHMLQLIETAIAAVDVISTIH